MPVLASRQDDAYRLGEIIAESPGLSQTQIVERSGMPRVRVLQILHIHDGEFWTTMRGRGNTLLYLPSSRGEIGVGDAAPLGNLPS